MRITATWEDLADQLALKLANTPPGSVRELLFAALRDEYGRGYHDGECDAYADGWDRLMEQG
jgi:hypothetical protein